MIDPRRGDSQTRQSHCSIVRLRRRQSVAARPKPNNVIVAGSGTGVGGIRSKSPPKSAELSGKRARVVSGI